ncbi:ATP-binding protein [Candidatus Magnetomoraceae bacterium gMMP-15]
MKYNKEPAFINRNNEIKFLQQWIYEKPEQILFLYGPKSSGKTTLLYKFKDAYLNERQFEVKFLNLREILIVNYKDFIQSFFGVDYSKVKGDVKEVREYNAKIFKLKVEVLKGLESGTIDPFEVMKKELQVLYNQNIRTVMILDELQALEGVYMNGQRELIKELFNFFVAMTKESHLCHIIISSSDSYFIERIYTDSKLTKTSRFLEIDYLTKKDVFYWLNHLKKESKIDNLTLTKKQIERIWYYFGGSVWEISNFLTTLLSVSSEGQVSNDKLEAAAQKEIQAVVVRFQDYIELHYSDVLFNKIYSILKKREFFTLRNFSGSLEKIKLREELGNLVRHNFFSYNPVTGEYKPQGHSIALGLQCFCEES